MSGPTSGPRGLTDEEVRARRDRDGRNVIPAARSEPAALQLLRQMIHFFALTLWVASGWRSSVGCRSWPSPLPSSSCSTGSSPSCRSTGRSVRAPGWRSCCRLEPASCATARSSRWCGRARRRRRRAARRRRPGQRRPGARPRVGVAVDESMLTGESVTAHPEVGQVLRAGTFVVEGLGRGTVVATGGRTRLAEIAALTRSARPTHEPLGAPAEPARHRRCRPRRRDGMPRLRGRAAARREPDARLPLRRGRHRGARSRGTAADGHPLARTCRAADGRTAGPRASPRVGRDPGLGDLRVHRQDGHDDPQRDERRLRLDAVGVVEVDGGGLRSPRRVRGVAAGASGGPRTRRSAVECVQGRAERSRPATRTTKGAGEGEETTERWVGPGRPDGGRGARSRDASRVGEAASVVVDRAYPFEPGLRRSAAVSDGWLHVIGAPDSLLRDCRDPGEAPAEVERLSTLGLRVLGVARRRLSEAGRTDSHDPTGHQASSNTGSTSSVSSRSRTRPAPA